MLEEFEQIVSAHTCVAFLGMLKEIGPSARTHRISVVIAAMLGYAVCRVPDEPDEGSLGEALLAIDEEPYLAHERSPQSEKLFELIDCLCNEAGMVNQRTDSRGRSYSIAENTMAEFTSWYNMPWEDYC